MTAEEIKQCISMQEVAERYEIKVNRKGFCKCIFHDEKTPSMKLYKDSFYCFSCQESGDIFTFVQKMDGISFKEAFRELGGGYDNSFSTKMNIYHRTKEREMLKKAEEKRKKKRELNNMLISIYMRFLDKAEPLSDGWCDCYNALQLELYKHEILNDPEEINGTVKQTG